MNQITVLLASLLATTFAAFPASAQEQSNSWDQWQEILPYFSSSTNANDEACK